MASDVPEQGMFSLFPEETVQYSVVGLNDIEGDQPDSTVRLPVDAISEVDDDDLRSALWDQFKSRNRSSNRAILVSTNQDGTFRHAVGIPTQLLGVTFTVNGPIEHTAPLDAVRRPKAPELRPAAAKQSRLQKILHWLSR